MPFLRAKCLKNRKSEPEQTIGTCTLHYGGRPVIICPKRFLAGDEAFIDAARLLAPTADEWMVVPEVGFDQGSVDYVVAAKSRGRFVDFVGLELQTLDTTGSIWAARKDLIAGRTTAGRYSFGMNWRMTAKTILVQVHHKLPIFAAVGRKLVLALQDCLWEYLSGNFDVSEVASPARREHPFHIHVYEFVEPAGRSTTSQPLRLKTTASATVSGVERMLAAGGRTALAIDDCFAKLAEREHVAIRRFRGRPPR